MSENNASDSQANRTDDFKDAAKAEALSAAEKGLEAAQQALAAAERKLAEVKGSCQEQSAEDASSATEGASSVSSTSSSGVPRQVLRPLLQKAFRRPLLRDLVLQHLRKALGRKARNRIRKLIRKAPGKMAHRLKDGPRQTRASHFLKDGPRQTRTSHFLKDGPRQTRTSNISHRFRLIIRLPMLPLKTT